MKTIRRFLIKRENKKMSDIKNCNITQICVAVAMLAGAFLTLVIIAFVMKFMPV